MIKSIRILFTGVVCAYSVVLSAAPDSEIGIGLSGPYPFLLKSTSSKQLVETARDHQWSINFTRSNQVDTIKLIAIRVQFQKDVSTLTTGNGLFFTTANLDNGDQDEKTNYSTVEKNNDTLYKYDRLPHDSTYFALQLEMAKSYFKKVSKGKLIITSEIYPKSNNEVGYSVKDALPAYSPGGKKKKESYDDYYNRKTAGLMRFINDAIAAANDAKADSPFANITYNASDKTFRDQAGHKTVFMILHAGASYLTNGGDGRGKANDTPSDLIDAFINRDFIKYYKDSLKLKSTGFPVNGKNGEMLLDEIMMCAETSNQDGLNWGIQGVLVNQIARQLGIPDLFSTSSGTSAIGSFCIMDFAGYSAGKGFIPPYPSAWVRAFMGWDNVKVASPGARKNYQVKALTSVLDRDSAAAAAYTGEDTTILLVPINDHEYYLVENRQRNLSGNKDLFKYDTTEDDKVIHIAQYPNNVNIEKNVVTTNSYRVIEKVNNNDISLPASGILVWHVDENIIRNRLANNFINADSLYRGVSLVEADGVNDLGITFSNAFYSAIYDYGGSEDIFPHQTRIKSDSSLYDSIGPYTRPSTRAKDGGHTYLSIKTGTTSPVVNKELYYLSKNDGDHYITNFSDSVFNVQLKWDFSVDNWPKRAAPDQFLEPLAVDIDNTQPGKEFFLIGKSGRCYLWPSDTSVNPYNKKLTVVNRSDIFGSVVTSADTVAYLDSIPTPAAMPSTVAGSIMIPSSNGNVYIIKAVSVAAGLILDTIRLNGIPSTTICNYRDSSWAAGTTTGQIIFGKIFDTLHSVKLPSDSAVCAIAAVRELGAIAVMQIDGTLSLLSVTSAKADSSIKITTGIGPYTLITGDLDKDNASEIIVADSRHGIWVYNRNLTLAEGWTVEPNDLCNIYSYTPENVERRGANRALFPVNNALPSLADINRDGYLDIVAGGSNGVYAINYKGVLVYGWPAYLDKKYWYQKGAVNTSPVVVTGKNREPLVLFASPTGENATFAIKKITKADSQRGIVWFTKSDGSIDSLTDLRKGEIDTIVGIGDSLVLPYIIPGSFVDAIGSNAKRPSSVIMKNYQSSWPLTTGSTMSTSPMIAFTNTNTTPDLFAVTTEGWIYRWQLAKDILPDSVFWAQSGYDNGRICAYGGAQLSSLVNDKEPLSLFSYPNPALIRKNVTDVVFRYKFNGPATNVKLEIFSYSGFRVYSNSTMGKAPNQLSGSYPDWNELTVSVKDFGPAVYRCRMEAKINGKTYSQYWKMAIIK